MMNKNARGISFTSMMAMLKIPGIIKPKIETLGFSGLEVRSFFRIDNPSKLVFSKGDKNSC